MHPPGEVCFAPLLHMQPIHPALAIPAHPASTAAATRSAGSERVSASSPPAPCNPYCTQPPPTHYLQHPATYQPPTPEAPSPSPGSKAPQLPLPSDTTLLRPPSLPPGLSRSPTPQLCCPAPLPCPSPAPALPLPPLHLPPADTCASPPSSGLVLSGSCLPASLPQPVGCPYDQSQLDPAHLLARTLQPVGFMHPGLASHPDLGQLDLAPAGPCPSSPDLHRAAPPACCHTSLAAAGAAAGEDEGEGSGWSSYSGAGPGRRSFRHRWQSTGSSGHSYRHTATSDRSSSCGSSDGSELETRLGSDVAPAAAAAADRQAAHCSPRPRPAALPPGTDFSQPSSGTSSSSGSGNTSSCSTSSTGNRSSCGKGGGGSGAVGWEAYQQGAMSLTPSPAATTGMRLPSGASTTCYTDPASPTPSPPVHHTEPATPAATPLLTTQPLYECVGRGSYDLGLLLAHLPATSPFAVCNSPAGSATFQPFLLPALLTRTASTAPAEPSPDKVARRITLAAPVCVTPGSVIAPSGAATRDAGDASTAGSAFAKVQALLDPTLLMNMSPSTGPPAASPRTPPQAHSPGPAPSGHITPCTAEAGAGAGAAAAAPHPCQPVATRQLGLWPAPSAPSSSTHSPRGTSQRTSQASTPRRLSSLAQPQPIYIGYTCSHPGDPFTPTAAAPTHPPGPSPCSSGQLPSPAPPQAPGSEGGSSAHGQLWGGRAPAGGDWLLPKSWEGARQRGPLSAPPSASHPCDVDAWGAAIRTHPCQAASSSASTAGAGRAAGGPASASGLLCPLSPLPLSPGALAVGAFIAGSPRTSMDYPAGHPTPGFGSSVSRCPPSSPRAGPLRHVSISSAGGQQQRGLPSPRAFMASKAWGVGRASVELERCSGLSKPGSEGGSGGSGGAAAGGGRGGSSSAGGAAPAHRPLG
ncbi:hypothetical protein V8C86DRAFT_115810 [Haematococcus lacustris]